MKNENSLTKTRNKKIKHPSALLFLAKYQSSCDSYYQAGARVSGVYIIDVDGPGAMEPTYVRCIMGYKEGDAMYGQTFVEHNLEDDTQIRGSNMVDMIKKIQYR